MLGYFEGDGHYRSDKRSDGAVRNSLECSTIYKNYISNKTVIVRMMVYGLL